MPSAEPTRREMQVAQLVAGGLSNKAIARELGISVRTVKNHIEALVKRLPPPRHNAACHARAAIYAWWYSRQPETDAAA